MHLIAVEFHRHCGPLIYVCALMTKKQILNITWSLLLHMYHSNEYSIRYYLRDLDDALLNALLWLGTPEVILKPEQWSVIVKFACGRLVDWVWEVPLLLFVLIVCQGSILLVVGAVVLISLSSCSFLLMVDEVINKLKMSHGHRLRPPSDYG